MPNVAVVTAPAAALPVIVVTAPSSPDARAVTLVDASGNAIDLTSGEPEPFVLLSTGPMGIGNFKLAPIGQAGAASLSAIGQNIAEFIPFTITTTRTYTGMIWINGATVNGNVNGAIYSADGTTALGTIGSVLQAGTTATQQKAFPSPVTLQPGTYFMALASDSATGTFVGRAMGVQSLRAAGCRSLAAFFALTASAAAWVGVTVNRCPVFGLYEASWL